MNGPREFILNERLYNLQNLKNNTIESIYKTEPDSQIQKTVNQWGDRREEEQYRGVRDRNYYA